MKGSKAFGRKEPMNSTNTGRDHTGPTHHGNAHMGSVKGKDSVAHPSHHEMNKKHGAGGFNPAPEYEGGEEDGMDNEEHC
jgi:hypothetical protein